jgi:hypothetical protein
VRELKPLAFFHNRRNAMPLHKVVITTGSENYQDCKDMKVGQIAQVMVGAYKGQFIMMTCDRRLVSLSNPNSTWSGPGEPSFAIEILEAGAVLEVTVGK